MDYLQILTQALEQQNVAENSQELLKLNPEQAKNTLFTLYQENKLDLSKILQSTSSDEDKICCELARFLGLDYNDLMDYNLHLLTQVPTNFLYKYEIIPFKEDEEFIYIAFFKPQILNNKEKIQALFRNKFIRFELSKPSKIKHLLKKISLDEQIRDLSLNLKLELKHSKPNEKASTASKFFMLIIKEAILNRASDIHFEPSEKEALIRFRVDGMLFVFLQIELELYQALISYIKFLAHLNVAEQRKAQDSSFELEIDGQSFDFRLSSLPLLNGESLVIRILERSKRILSLKDLNLEKNILEAFKKAIFAPYGFILITGPTGSGKSTTLYASLNEIQSPRKKIITAEDPIEYRLSSAQQIVLNEKAGLDFNNALRAILRQDPDVIMIGEIRDEESLDIALKSALTGHLVLSTLHTNDAISAIARMIDMNAKPYLLASALSVVVAQRLLRKLCNHCKKKSADEYEGLKGEFYEAVGCEYCNMSGFIGRELVAEFLFVDEKMNLMIRENENPKHILKYAKSLGFKTMLDRALEKASKGIVSCDEITRVIK